MVSTFAENPISENGGCSLLKLPPKYKRPRVSAVRDFPPGCGPNAPQANCSNGKKVEGRSIVEEIKELDIVLTEEKTVVEEINELPYHPIPSTIVWKERIYPSRTHFSAVRDYPAGCGPRLPEKGHLRMDPVQSQPKPEKDELREENIQVIVAEVQINEGEKHEKLKPVDDDGAIGKDCKDTILYGKDKGKRKRATLYPDNSSIKREEKTVSTIQKEDIEIVFALRAPNNNQLKASSSSSLATVKKHKKSVADRGKKLK